MENFNATKQDLGQAERIRRQYLEKNENKMEQLRLLDSRVKTPGTVVSSIVGGIGALVMGGGMSLVMVYDNMVPGIILGIVGILVAAVAYPIYKSITVSRKKKYAAEIMKLTVEIIGK